MDIKDKLYNLNEIYYQIEYDLGCLKNILERYEDYEEETFKHDLKEVVHISGIVINEVINKLSDSNEKMDRLITNMK